MTREDAIKLIEHMSLAFVPTDQYGDYIDPEPYEEAVDMAIEALSERNIARDIATILENEQDMRVMLQNAERPKDEWCTDCKELDRGKHWDGHTEEDVTRLLSLPPVTSTERTGEWIDLTPSEGVAENAPTTDLNCPHISWDGDLISRSEILGAIDRTDDSPWATDEVVAMIESAPSVIPTEQQGHGRLIDADRLLQETFTVDEEEWTTPEIRAILENVPTIVTPTERTGKWVEYWKPSFDGTSYKWKKCSVCDHDMIGDETNYCPNCGAKMGK